MTQPFDENSLELPLQRLADGELDQAQTRALVAATDASAETDPTAKPWRAVAVTLIENQLWQQAFRESSAVNAKGSRRSGSTNQPTPTTQPANPLVGARELSEAARQVAPAGSGFSSWPALAAGLLVAAAVGYGVGAVFNGSGDQGINATQMAGTPAPPAARDAVALDRPSDPDQPKYHLRLTDAKSIDGALADSSIPLYEPAAFQKMHSEKPIEFYGSGMSNADLQQLYRSGYQVQQNVNFMSGKLNDGRAFVVPVRTINLSTGQ